MSDADARVELVLLWHHHQPDYRRPRDGEALLPWVRLHATKDYLDMALRLERHPGVRATFNFVPTLLDQLDAVAAGAPEALIGLLRRPVESLSAPERAEVVRRCRVAPRHALERWPAYRALVRTLDPDADPAHHDDRDLLALGTWFLLAWLDPMFHDEPAARAAVMAPRIETSHRDALLALSDRLTREVVPAYRRLADAGRIELSQSAYCHPILPLLCDVRTARRAQPEAALPVEPFHAPEDAERQVRRALDRHAEAFGARPAGMWPPEGSVSPEVAEIAARAGLRWLASDEEVLWRSLAGQVPPRAALYQPRRDATPAGDVTLLFRDHELSDRIGFVDAHWDPREAVADFMARLRRIGRDHAARSPAVVTVILDGENCWEHYAEDGGPFLDGLYAALAAADDVVTRTPSDLIGTGREAPLLPELHSGSWIGADFHIWIGHPEKNAAWDRIARARRALVESSATPDSHPEAWRSLDAAEGSDWMWWFGEDHFTVDKALFDRIFREHLHAVYERAGLEPPGTLRVPVAAGPSAAGALEHPIGFVRPVIDGRSSHFYEWYAAGIHVPGSGGSMHRERGRVRRLLHGFDEHTLYLRLDFEAGGPGDGVELVVEQVGPQSRRFATRGLAGGAPAVERIVDGAARPVAGAACRVDSLLELGLPFEALGLGAGDSAELLLHLARNGTPIETLPAGTPLRVTAPDAGYAESMWSA